MCIFINKFINLNLLKPLHLLLNCINLFVHAIYDIYYMNMIITCYILIYCALL